MAGIMNRPNNKSLQLVSDIVFEGALLSDTRATLVSELINYILYERQQIPLPTDQLKIRTDASTVSKNSPDEEHESKLSFKKQHIQNTTDRKAKLFLEDHKKLCDNLKRSFVCCPEIDKVAILLGGTVVSPKESYIIKFPPTCPDADCLPLKVCKNTLFKQIIGEDILGSMKTSLSPSSIMILLSAPRSCPLSWFLPKHSISPRTGTVISFNFHCVYLVPIRHDLSMGEDDCDTFDLSGLEAIGCTLCDNDDKYKDGECVEDSVLGHSRRKSSEMFPSSDVNLQQVPTSEKLGRFCRHRRLNYVFSAQKKGKKTVIDSPLGSPFPQSYSITCGVESSSNFELKDNNMDVHNAQSDKLFTDNTDSLFADRNSPDCIWYQSPVTLKGFKDQIDSNQKLFI